MALSQVEVARRILEAMAQEVLAQTRANLLTLATNSRRAQSLRDDLRVQIIDVNEQQSEAHIITDYYWALYYHDGRGAMTAKPGKFLVFFRNPDDDPRIDGPARNYPRRAQDAKKLTLSRGEFNRLLRSRRLIATKRVGPAPAHPFMELGFAALQSSYGPKVSAIWSRHVREFLAEEDLLDREETIEIDL